MRVEIPRKIGPFTFERHRNPPLSKPLDNSGLDLTGFTPDPASKEFDFYFTYSPSKHLQLLYEAKELGIGPLSFRDLIRSVQSPTMQWEIMVIRTEWRRPNPVFSFRVLDASSTNSVTLSLCQFEGFYGDIRKVDPVTVHIDRPMCMGVRVHDWRVHDWRDEKGRPVSLSSLCNNWRGRLDDDPNLLNPRLHLQDEVKQFLPMQEYLSAGMRGWIDYNHDYKRVFINPADASTRV